MTRGRMQAIVSRALDDLDDRSVNGDEEGRFLEVEHLLGTVDWGCVPLDVIREMFALLVRRLSADALTRGARGEPGGLIGEAERLVAMHDTMRAELAYETSTGLPCPRGPQVSGQRSA